MERFVSNYTKKIDAKGRVSVPPAFRAILQRKGDEQIYMQLAVDTPSILAGGSDLLELFEKRMADMDPFSIEYEDWAAHFYSGSDFLKIDGDGRIVLTDAMKEHAGISDEVLFAGRGHSFQIWSPKSFEDYMGNVRSRVRAQRAAERSAGEGAQ